MVKEVKIQEALTVPSDVFFRIIFWDGSFLRRYHKEVNGDSGAQISPWNQQNTRTIDFTMPMEGIPTVVSRLLGVASVNVHEVQSYQIEDARYAVGSSPIINIPGGDKFTSKAFSDITPAANPRAGCQLTLRATVTCVGIWGLQGTIEDVMSAKAREGMAKWLALAKRHLEDVLTDAAVSSSLVPLQPGAAMPLPWHGSSRDVSPQVLLSLDDGEDAFFDCTRGDSDGESFGMPDGSIAQLVMTDRREPSWAASPAPPSRELVLAQPARRRAQAGSANTAASVVDVAGSSEASAAAAMATAVVDEVRVLRSNVAALDMASQVILDSLAHLEDRLLGVCASSAREAAAAAQHARQAWPQRPVNASEGGPHVGGEGAATATTPAPKRWSFFSGFMFGSTLGTLCVAGALVGAYYVRARVLASSSV
eukprot:jgi/Mesvir1/14353/Mv09760-RA.1